jgi:hypothetical protein
VGLKDTIKKKYNEEINKADNKRDKNKKTGKGLSIISTIFNSLLFILFLIFTILTLTGLRSPYETYSMVSNFKKDFSTSTSDYFFDYRDLKLDIEAKLKSYFFDYLIKRQSFTANAMVSSLRMSIYKTKEIPCDETYTQHDKNFKCYSTIYTEETTAIEHDDIYKNDYFRNQVCK